jgi:hypothetical protein
MSPHEWVGFSVGVSTLIGAVALGVRHLVKHYLNELKPNGGTSLRDEQNRQSEIIKRLETRIDAIYEMLLNVNK